MPASENDIWTEICCSLETQQGTVTDFRDGDVYILDRSSSLPRKLIGWPNLGQIFFFQRIFESYDIKSDS